MCDYMALKVLFIDFSETLAGADGLASDALSFLDAVKGKYYLAIIAEEKADEINGRLEALGIRSRFQLVVSADDYGMKKPEHRLINISLALINDNTGETVTKQDCLLVGDRPDWDIKMGNIAGVKTIRIKRGAFSNMEPYFDDEKAAYTFVSLTDALPIIAPGAKQEKAEKAEKKEEKAEQPKKPKKKARKKK